MILAFDIGNTHIVTGILDSEGKVLMTFRAATDKNMTEDQFFAYLKSAADFNGIDLKKVEGLAVSSVVPGLVEIFQYLGRKYFKTEPVVVDISAERPFDFIQGCDYSDYGPDRIIAVAKAVADHPGKNLVIFDFGTATNYEILKDGVYVGGGIFAGLEMNLKALFGNTALLSEIPFKVPETVLGINTAGQIQGGVFYGYVGQVKHIIARIKEEVENPYIIATGGQGKDLVREIDEIDEYCPDLNLQGLYIMYRLNSK